MRESLRPVQRPALKSGRPMNEAGRSEAGWSGVIKKTAGLTGLAVEKTAGLTGTAKKLVWLTGVIEKMTGWPKSFHSIWRQEGPQSTPVY